MTMRINAITAFVATSAVLLAVPAAAVDGEILIDQAKVNAGGITPGDAPGFPATLGKSGRYKLTGNLKVPAGKDGIEVTHHDVAVDLNGFTISSNPPGEAYYGVRASAVDGLRVFNGTIAGFQPYGIYQGGGGGLVEDMRIVSNGTGIDIKTGARIRNSTIANNTSSGIRCGGCLIEGNVVADNANGGIFDSSAGGGLVLGNVIAFNGAYGLVAPSAPYPKTGYGNNILFANNGGGLQVLDAVQMHPNICEPACP